MWNKRSVVLSLAFVGWGLLAAASAEAGVKSFELEPTNESIKVEGLVRLTTKGSFEKLDLRLFSGDLKDGTILLVSVVRDDFRQPIPVARMEMVLGSALLQLNNRKDVSAIFPLKGLVEIHVSLPGHGDLAVGVVPPGVRLGG